MAFRLKLNPNFPEEKAIKFEAEYHAPGDLLHMFTVAISGHIPETDAPLPLLRQQARRRVKEILETVLKDLENSETG